MNSLLALYRKTVPSDTRSDPVITLELGDQFPDALEKFPDFKAEYEGLRAWQAEANKPTVGERVKQAGGELVRGAAGIIASVPEAIGVQADALQRNYPSPGVGDGPSSFHDVARKIREGAAAITPEPVEGLESSFLNTKVPRGIGSAVGFLTGGAVGRAAKIPGALGIAGLGAAAGGVEAWEEAKRKGASDEDAYKVFVLNAGVGTTEALPLARMLDRLDKATGGGFRKVLFNAGKETIEEALQEAVQSSAKDLIAKEVYDPERKLFKDLKEDAAVGGVTGFLFSLLTQGIGRRATAVGAPSEIKSKSTSKSKAEISPVAHLETRPEVAAELRALAERELGGDTSVAVQSALARVYSDPDQHAAYTIERNRLAAEAPKPQTPPAPPATIPAEVPDAVPLLSDTPEPVETELEYEGGELPDYKEPEPVFPRETTANVSPSLQRVREAAVLAEPVELGAEFEAMAELVTSGERLTLPQMRRLATISPQERDQYLKLVAEKRDARKAERQERTTNLVDNSSKLVVPAQVAVPAVDAGTQRRAQLQRQIDAYEKDYVESAKRLEAGQLTEPGKRGPGHGQRRNVVRRLDYLKREIAALKERQARPMSGKLFDVADIDTETTDADIGLKEGKTTFPAYYAIGDASPAGLALEEAVTTGFTPGLGEMLVRQAARNDAPKAHTRRLTAFAHPTDQRVMVLGTFKASDRSEPYNVAQPGAKGISLKKFMEQGWRPFASIRTSFPQNSPALVYENRAEYDADFGTAPDMVRAARDRGVAVAEQIESTAFGEDGGADEGEEVPTPDVAHAQAVPEGFAVQHAEAIWGALQGMTAAEVDKNFTGAIGARRQAVAALSAALKRIIGNNNLSADDALAYFKEAVYGAYANSGGRKEKFVEAIQAATNSAGTAATARSWPAGTGGLPAQGPETVPSETAIEAAAAQVADSPTDKQKAAGNYQKGHVVIDGLDVTIETPKGSQRSGVGKWGKPWSVTMPAHYGYVKGTEGRDGDQVDVYIGPNPESGVVYVVDQINPATKNFDEHKALIGFTSREEAMATYIAGFSDGSGPSRIGEMTQMTKDDFVDWVNEGDTKRPLAYGKKFSAGTVRMKYRAGGELPFTAAPEVLSQKWITAIDGARAAGLDVKVVQARAGDMLAQWTPGKVIIPVADAIHPSPEQVVALFHEIGHEVFAGFPAEVQAKMQAAVRRALDGKFALDGWSPTIDGSVTDPDQQEAIALEERLVESVAREITAGDLMDTPAAKHWAGQLWLAIKDAWMRILMALQESRFGKGISPDLAQGYLVNRMQRFMAGDLAPMSYTSWMGEPRYREISFVNDETTAPSSDVEATALAAKDVAAQNTVNDVLQKVYAEWSGRGHNAAGLSFDEFVASGNFVQLDELPAEVIARVNEGLKAANLPEVPPDTKIDVLLSTSFQQRAASGALRTLREIHTTNSKRRKESEWALSVQNKGNLVDKLGRANQRLIQLQSDYTNADMLLHDARQQVRTLLGDFREDTKDVKSLARKAGILTQVIRGIDNRATRPVLRQYERAINRLFTRLSGDEAGRAFMDTLQRAAEVTGIDWENDTAGVIRDKLIDAATLGDPKLEVLLDAEMDTQALLSVLVAFGKSNQHVMDLLQLRRSQALAERQTINAALTKAMEDSKSAINEARGMVNKLPRLARVADRLLTRLEKLKGENHDLMDEIHRLRTFIDFHHDTTPLLRSEMARLEGVIGAIDEEWEPVDGAEYMVPGSDTATIQQVEANKKVYRLRANGSSTAEVRADMAKMKAWLDAVPVDQRGATWGTVKRQYDQLAQQDLNFAHTSIQSGFMTRFLGPLTDRLKFVGTPAARAAAKRLETMTFWLGSKSHTAHELGTRWALAESQAMKALGVKRRDVFRREYFNTALSFIEKRQDLLAADPTTAVTNVLRELRLYFQNDTAMQQTGAWAAFTKLINLTADNATWLDKNRSEMGIKIKDGDGYRESIGATPFTVLRGVGDWMQEVYDKMAPAWVDRITADEVAALYGRAPDGLRQALNPRFTPETLNHFVGPIINRTGRSAFYAPAGPDGLNRFALRERAIHAWELSNNDVVTFAEELFQLEGGQGDVAEFVGETLSTFQSFFNVLHEIHRDESHGNQLGAMVPRRYLMDARKSEEFPAEWMDYYTYDTHGMRQVVKLQANEKAFGRDMAAMRSDLTTALKEQEGLHATFRELHGLFPDLVGGKLKKAVREEARRRGLDPTVLEQAGKNLDVLKRAQGQFDAILKIGSERPMELRPWMELLSAMTAATVQGPGTALIDTISVVEQPFRKLGLSTEALHLLKESVQSTAGTALGSFAQMFRRQIGVDAEYHRLLLELGHYDEDAVLGMKEKLKAIVGEPVATQSAALHAVTTTARVVRAGLSTGIGRAKEGATAVFPTVKPHAIFSQAAQTIHAGQIIGWWKVFEAFTGKAVKHFEANPADLTDAAFEFKPEQLGYRQGQRAWDYLRASLNRYGLSLEQVAREAVERRRVDPNAMLLSKEQYRALAQHGVNEVTLEASIVTRPPEFLTSPFWSMVNPLLGWSLAKGVDMMKAFRAPNGQWTKRAAFSGIMAYAAILPIGLAYALMRDWYDEEIVGKKSNTLSVTTADNAGEFAVAAIDSLARVGTFGFAGEAVNGIFNLDTTRELSVDSRVYFVSNARNTYKTLATWYQQGTSDWQTVWRPLAQSLGGSGYLQYADIVNNATGWDNAEARVAKRIGVNNYLRTVGRELNLDVRTGRGMAALPNPIKPYIGQMVLAAYANNPEDFREAYRSALLEARQQKKPDPEDHVARSFQAYHPLRMVFRTEPSEQEYQKILGAMDEDGRATVATSVRLYNEYAKQVGASPTIGRKPKSNSLVPRFKVAAPSLEEIRRLATAVGAF